MVESPSVTLSVPEPPAVSVRTMPSPVELMAAWTPVVLRLMALITSPIVCMLLVTWIVDALPSVSVIWKLPVGDAGPAVVGTEERVLRDGAEVQVAAVEGARGAGARAGGRGKAELRGRVEAVAAVGGRQRSRGPPGRIDELDPVAGGVDLGRDVHVLRPAASDWLLMSSITSCSVTAPARLTLTEFPLPSVSFMVAQGPQSLAAVEIGKEHGLQPAEDGAARDGVGSAWNRPIPRSLAAVEPVALEIENVLPALPQSRSCP